MKEETIKKTPEISVNENKKRHERRNDKEVKRNLWEPKKKKMKIKKDR